MTQSTVLLTPREVQHYWLQYAVNDALYAYTFASVPMFRAGAAALRLLLALDEPDDVQLEALDTLLDALEQYGLPGAPALPAAAAGAYAALCAGMPAARETDA
jgi:hypothetical protein